MQMRERTVAVSTTSVAIVVVVLLVLAAGGYYVLGRSSTSSGPGSSSTSASGSSSTSSASSTESTVSNSSSSCTTTAGSTLADYASLFGNASAMSLSYDSNGIAGQLSGTSSYSVVYAPTGVSSTFKVNMSQTGSGNGSELAWITTDGDVLAVYSLGQNHTGTEAQSLFQVYMAPFELESAVAGEVDVYLASPSVGAVNQTQVSVGPTTMQVTTYRASSDFTIEQCGVQATVYTFTLQMGTVPGTKLDAIVYWFIQETVEGGETSLSATLDSVTAA